MPGTSIASGKPIRKRTSWHRVLPVQAGLEMLAIELGQQVQIALILAGHSGRGPALRSDTLGTQRST